jgi:hypothetical protein
MGGIIRLVPKSELERLRLIREARAIYDSIFPPASSVGEQSDGRSTHNTLPPSSDLIPLLKSAVESK